MGRLSQFHRSSQADFVLVRLLDHPQLDSEARRQCADWAAGWLTERLDDDQNTHLLRPLLQTASRCGGEVDANTIIVLAGRWLDRHPHDAERPYVMARLLRLPRLPDRAWLEVAVRAMMEMDRCAGSASDDHLLSSVINRLSGMRQEHRELWLRLSRRWVAAHGDATAVGQFTWNGKIKSSRVVDRHFELLWPECVRRFGPGFLMGQ